MLPMFLGALFSAAGALIGGIGKKKAGKAQAEAAKLNAQQVRERAAIETTLRTREGFREAGSIQAAAGAGGTTGGGSAADILRESARNAAFDVQTIKSQSALEADAFELGGKAAKKAGNIGFLGGALDSASILLGS